MRIALVTVGTRGDAQPIVALGAELLRRGHRVNVGVPPNLVAFARRAGLDSAPIGNDSQAFMESSDGRQLLASGNVADLRFVTLSEQTLHDGLSKAMDPAVRRRARRLAETLRAEGGATIRTASIIESRRTSRRSAAPRPAPSG